MAKITINGISTDPLAPSPATAAFAESLLPEDASDSDFILIQTTEPLDRAQKEELADNGAQILEYVPENTYLCRFEPEDLSPIQWPWSNARPAYQAGCSGAWYIHTLHAFTRYARRGLGSFGRQLVLLPGRYEHGNASRGGLCGARSRVPDQRSEDL